MTTRDDLRSHAIGQQAAEELLRTQEQAAAPRLDREWVRLRKVDTIARRLMLAKPEDREEIMEELDEALWPEQDDEEEQA